DVTNESRLVEIGGEQLRVARLHAAVAADIEIPAFLGGGRTIILPLRLRAFARTARDTELQLVGRAQPLVTALQLDREADAVLHAVPAPCRAHAGLHRPQGLAVRMPRLEAGCDQVCPDERQLVHPGAEEIDALTTGYLGVQAELAGHFADGDQLLGRDLASRNARHHGIRAVLLHVGKEVVVGVLQRRTVAG